MKILFLYLTAFSLTGGTEKYNKAFMKALRDISVDGIDYKILSAYDDKPDELYADAAKFKGFKANRIKFSLSAVREGIKCDKVFISHINLAPIGLIIKMINPKVKIYLTAHGIEVWDKLPFLKEKALKSANIILAVSSFTKNKLIEKHNIPSERIIVFHNTLDPYFKIPEKFEKPPYLINRYGFDDETKVLLTVGRIVATEGFKGYDRVIEVLSSVKEKFPKIKFLLAGKYDEKKRIDSIIEKQKLKDTVIMPGFIKDEELADHYLLADLFVMPSKQEGFGIVFLEAMACGLPVIAGNKDGSRDAIAEGTEFNIVDPDNEAVIKNAILDLLNKKIDKEKQRDLALKKFGFEQFRDNLKAVLER